ncbi:hypothetical protein SRABI04_04454 [Chryseobacterium sp. Bi04]|nr:hypothetical protein SRABI04_04454 [Chryseobacterium sp. Bi04]
MDVPNIKWQNRIGEKYLCGNFDPKDKQADKPSG